MERHSPRHDELAVSIVVEIDDYLARLAAPLDQRTRRSRMIRSAIEGQVEYYEPPPDAEVLRLLAGALVKQASALDADTAWLNQKLDQLQKHISQRMEV